MGITAGKKERTTVRQGTYPSVSSKFILMADISDRQRPGAVAINLYSWRRKDPRTRRWRVLRWKMTVEDAKRWAKQESAEIEQIPNSEEIRTDVSGRGAVFFPAQSTEAIEQHFTDLGAKPEYDE